MSYEISIHIFVYVIIKMNQILSNNYISHLNYSYISYEFHFASETFLEKIRICSIIDRSWFDMVYALYFTSSLIFPISFCVSLT